MNDFKPLPGCVRTRSETHSNEKPNTFGREDKLVQTRSQTHSDEKPNALGQEAKHNRTRAKCVRKRKQLRLTIRQTRSDEKLNAFAQLLHEFERNAWMSKTHLNENFPTFEQEPTRVWTTTCMSSSENQHAFEWGPWRVWTRIYMRLIVNCMRSFHMYNTFALYLVSDGYCI